VTDFPWQELDTDALLARDAARLLPAAATAGAQVRATVAEFTERAADIPVERPRSVVVLADGRAARDAELAVALIGPDCPVPLVIRPDLPLWVGALDVVVVLESGTPFEPTAAAVAARRGAVVLGRGAARGDLAEAVPHGVSAPRLSVPEALAGPGRVSYLLCVFSALNLLRPALDSQAVDIVADLLDSEAIACAPQTDAFVNPALSLAEQVAATDLVLIGIDECAVALARRSASVLAELGGAACLSANVADITGSAALLARLGKRRDVFADPYEDGGPETAPLRPVLLRVSIPAGETAGRHVRRSFDLLHGALPHAVVLDGPDLSLTQSITSLPEQAVRPEPAGWVRTWASAALMMLRLDFAATYLGIAAGQVAPADVPSGLGPHISGFSTVRPDTVGNGYRQEEDVDRWN
jgi:hypothetical protein